MIAANASLRVSSPGPLQPLARSLSRVLRRAGGGCAAAGRGAAGRGVRGQLRLLGAARAGAVDGRLLLPAPPAQGRAQAQRGTPEAAAGLQARLGSARVVWSAGPVDSDTWLTLTLHTWLILTLPRAQTCAGTRSVVTRGVARAIGCETWVRVGLQFQQALDHFQLREARGVWRYGLSWS